MLGWAWEGGLLIRFMEGLVEKVCVFLFLHFSCPFFGFVRGGWISGISIRRSWTEWIMIDMGRASFFILNQSH